MSHDRVNLFDNGIVWIEFAPVWCLIVWEWISARHGGKCLGIELTPILGEKESPPRSVR